MDTCLQKLEGRQTPEYSLTPQARNSAPHAQGAGASQWELRAGRGNFRVENQKGFCDSVAVEKATSIIKSTGR